MSKVPFEKFIITLLISGKTISEISAKLNTFGYYITDDEISEIFNDIKSILPDPLTEKLNNKILFSLNDEPDVGWLLTFGIYELYDFILNKDSKNNPPPYFKWIRDCIWIHNYRDIMLLVNILLFNGEELESISRIISFKYKKKIGIEALVIYKKIFWSCDFISAKEALYHCTCFRNNALIIKNVSSAGIAEISKLDKSSSNGLESTVIFNDANYIKWKIGYKEISIPTVENFINDVKRDSYYKYYETMNMEKSVEEEEEEGYNDKIGSFNSVKIHKRNVEEQKAKEAKNWFDLFMKANTYAPKDDSEEFFKKMSELKLEFTEEKLININESSDILKDLNQK